MQGLYGGASVSLCGWVIDNTAIGCSQAGSRLGTAVNSPLPQIVQCLLVLGMTGCPSLLLLLPPLLLAQNSSDFRPGPLDTAPWRPVPPDIRRMQQLQLRSQQPLDSGGRDTGIATKDVYGDGQSIRVFKDEIPVYIPSGRDIAVKAAIGPGDGEVIPDQALKLATYLSEALQVEMTESTVADSVVEEFGDLPRYLIMSTEELFVYEKKNKEKDNTEIEFEQALPQYLNESNKSKYKEQDVEEALPQYSNEKKERNTKQPKLEDTLPPVDPTVESLPKIKAVKETHLTKELTRPIAGTLDQRKGRTLGTKGKLSSGEFDVNAAIVINMLGKEFKGGKHRSAVDNVVVRVVKTTSKKTTKSESRAQTNRKQTKKTKIKNISNQKSQKTKPTRLPKPTNASKVVMSTESVKLTTKGPFQKAFSTVEEKQREELGATTTNQQSTTIKPRAKSTPPKSRLGKNKAFKSNGRPTNKKSRQLKKRQHLSPFSSLSSSS